MMYIAAPEAERQGDRHSSGATTAGRRGLVTRFFADLSLVFTERPFLERRAATAKAGFGASRIRRRCEHDPNKIGRVCWPTEGRGDLGSVDRLADAEADAIKRREI